ncbi:MAG: YdcF family protein [Thermomicrobiales bacterium]
MSSTHGSPPASTWPDQRPPTAGTLRTISPSIEEQRRAKRTGPARWLYRFIMFMVVAIPVTILLVMAAVYWQARTDEARPVDAIVILGAAQYNGRPSEVLEARLEQALSLWNQGLAPKIVVTGGKQPGDAFTEAETEATYLIERGVPEDAILFENRGRDTWQSMQGVQEVLRGTGVKSMLIVSDGFHLLRAKLMARDLGFTAYGSPAKNSPITPWSGDEFSYVIRETGGILVFLPKLVF